ncbi:MAG: PEGA domain-containing protein [Candidatus Magasanikbacteria bacterium]|nr:PEGA domain-containing protein [Candidatus Magasanikbacteria bacterium]
MYPKTRLTRPIRRLIMCGLILIYAIIAPLVIFYTAGYRYNFQDRAIKQTGVLSVDIKPKNALVYLNDVLLNQNLPIYLPNRAPGSYKIRLTLPGYKNWEKDILIESKKTAYIKNITLFKESLPTQAMEKYFKPIANVLFSPTAVYFIMVGKNENTQEIDLVNTGDFSIQPIWRGKSNIEPIISWSPFNDFAFIKTSADGAESIQLLNAADLTLNKTYNFPRKISGVQWSENATEPTLFLETDNQIVSIDTKERKNLIKTESDVWYVKSENEIWLAIAEKEIASYDSNGIQTKKIQLRDEVKKIIDINQSRVITGDGQNINATLLENGASQNVITTPTQNVFFNSKTKEWLAWSPWELWSIYEDGKAALLNRTSEKINLVLPLDDYGVLLLASENKITGFNPGYYVTHELLNNTLIEQIAVDTTRRLIFFFGEVGQKRGLFELEY